MIRNSSDLHLVSDSFCQGSATFTSPKQTPKQSWSKLKTYPSKALIWRQLWFWWLKSQRICPCYLCAQSLVLTRLCLFIWSGAQRMKVNISC